MDVEEGSGLTRRGWSLFGAALGLLVGSRILGTVELAVLAMSALVLLAASAAWTLRSSLRLRADRTVRPRRAMVGEEARVDLTVTNPSARRTPIVGVADVFHDGRRAARFVLPPLPAGEQAAAAYRVPTHRRGRFAIGPLLVIVHDPFGLVRRRFVLLEADDLLVRPRVHPLVTPPLGGGRSSDQPGDARALVGEGEEFLALREYEVGDDLRRVHWRSTARRDQLMIRQHEAHRQARAVVVLDVRPGAHDGPSFERAIEAAASVAFRLVRARRHVDVVLSTGEELRGGLDAVLDRLAVIEPRGPDRFAPLAGRTERALTVAVVAGVDRELAAHLVELGARGPAVVVTTRVPGMPTRAAHVIDASTDLVTAWNTAIASWPIGRSSPVPARR